MHFIQKRKPRITPAYAGISEHLHTVHALAGDHPRIRGDKPELRGFGGLGGGSPPHTRG